MKTSEPPRTYRAGRLLGRVLAGALSLSACDTESDDPSDAGATDTPPEEVTEFAVEFGRRDLESGAFLPLASDETIPLIIGFQGLMFVDLVARAGSAAPDMADATTWVRFDDPAMDYQLRASRLEFTEVEPGRREIGQFRVSFGIDASLLVGKHIRIVSDFTAPGWHGEGAAAWTLDADRVCSEDPDGTVTCEIE